MLGDGIDCSFEHSFSGTNLIPDKFVIAYIRIYIVIHCAAIKHFLLISLL
jgi:hypothetical protein